MLYFVEVSFLSDGRSDNFDAAPMYAAYDAFGNFYEIGMEKDRAWKAYHDMMRASRKVRMADAERAKIAQRYYDARDDEIGETFISRYALNEINSVMYFSQLQNSKMNWVKIKASVLSADLTFDD